MTLDRVFQKNGLLNHLYGLKSMTHWSFVYSHKVSQKKNNFNMPNSRWAGQDVDNAQTPHHGWDASQASLEPLGWAVLVRVGCRPSWPGLFGRKAYGLVPNRYATESLPPSRLQPLLVTWTW
jgi:hypothetical protein